jgi:MFS family permease
MHAAIRAASGELTGMTISRTQAPAPSANDAAPPPSAFGPMRAPVFRMLWLTWLIANTCMWMNDVAAAWMMTSLTTAPIWVALVQTASMLPVFLLGLPSGALADILDRRRYFIITQFWVAVVATILCAVILADAITPPVLLALTFANGIGLAMRWPVFSAIVPELVPRAQLPAALALNGVAMNASRIAGPLAAGAIIASLGSAYVFVLNAVLSVISGFVIMRWRRTHVPSPLGRERIGGAMRVGLQFARHSNRVKAVLARVAASFFHSTALMALLPLVARAQGGGGAGVFTLLLACMGGGAISAVFFLPRMRQAFSRDTLVMASTVLSAAMIAVAAVSTNVVLTSSAMWLSGMAFIVSANSLSVSMQMALPDWVRARGMSIYQMALMGASATGAAVWGQVATLDSVQHSLLYAAGSSVVVMALVLRLIQDRELLEDMTPSSALKALAPSLSPLQDGGRLVLTVEYRIDPERTEAFMALMELSRRARLRQGALSWTLLRDVSDPGLFTEQIIDPSWTEHLRRFDRATAGDAALRERKLAFHLGPDGPVITRRLVAKG